MNGYILQIIAGTFITMKLACFAAFLGILFGLLAAGFESIPYKWLRCPLSLLVFIIRAFPELLVLFFIYFGLAIILRQLFHHYIDISPFVAGVTALSLIFGAYASHVFRGAFLAIDKGQLEAARAMGFSHWQIMTRIQIPQAWRHAIPGLGNLWLVLLKDTAIVTLIGLSDLMNQAKLAASSTHQPFTYYLFAACIYLVITSFSQFVLAWLNRWANRYVHS